VRIFFDGDILQKHIGLMALSSWMAWVYTDAPWSAYKVK